MPQPLPEGSDKLAESKTTRILFIVFFLDLNNHITIWFIERFFRRQKPVIKNPAEAKLVVEKTCDNYVAIRLDRAGRQSRVELAGE
jgi:hypothetical protein